jgi:hypothetical protein
MWSVKTKVIPVIIGAAGTILKSFRQYLSNVPGNDGTAENSHILHWTHTVLRKVLV